MKVFGTETLDFVADEALQMLGGYGFIAEYPVERHYRDSRINRIFEGTNEINRLIIPATLMKRIGQGGSPYLEFLQQVEREIADRARVAAGRRRARSSASTAPPRWRSASSPTPRACSSSATSPRSRTSSSTSRSSPT